MDKDNSGVLFSVTEKKNDAGPDFTGTLVLGKDLLDSLVKAVRAGGVAKVSLSAWNNTSKAGNSYKGIKVSEFREKKKDSLDDILG